MTTRVLVTGDRNWTDKDIVRKVLRELYTRWHNITIVHGACRGLDTIAGDVALELGMKVDAHPADWSKFHRAAGPIRNREMLDTGPVLCIAFHNDLAISRGTRNMVRQCLEVEVPVVLVRGDCSMEELTST